MDRLLELLAKVNDLTADETAELNTLLAESFTDDARADMTDEQVAAVEAALVDAFDANRLGGEPRLDLLTALSEATDTVRAEDAERQAAAEAAQAQIDELASRVHASNAGDGDESDDEDSSDDADDDEGAEAATDEAPQPVTAAATATRRPRPVSLNRLQRNGAETPDADEPPRRRITASSTLGQFNAGAEIPDRDALNVVVADAISRVKNHRGALTLNLARFSIEYPEDRRLSPTDARANDAIIAAVRDSAMQARRANPGMVDATFESLVAAGGLCAPLPVRYDQDVIGDTNRPVADALGTFDASRGGVRFVPGPTLSDIGTDGEPGDTDAAIGIWTMADDEAANPANTGTFKTIQRIDCPDEQSLELYMITARLAIGNIQAMTWPERVAAIIRLADVAYARTAEQAALARIQALSTAVAGFSPTLGSFRDLLAEWGAAAYNLRVRNRVGRETPVRVIAPEHARTSIILDIQRQLPGDDTTGRAVAIMNAALAEIGVAVTWTPDLVVPGAVAGTLTQVPTSVSYSIALEGTFSLTTGLTLDLGFSSNTPIRDSRLNAVNDYELFQEGAEQVAKFGGTQALWVTTDVCPTGATGGTVDIVCDAS